MLDTRAVLEKQSCIRWTAAIEPSAVAERAEKLCIAAAVCFAATPEKKTKARG